MIQGIAPRPVRTHVIYHSIGRTVLVRLRLITYFYPGKFLKQPPTHQNLSVADVPVDGNFCSPVMHQVYNYNNQCCNYQKSDKN
jgi:hypothetical protein